MKIRGLSSAFVIAALCLGSGSSCTHGDEPQPVEFKTTPEASPKPELTEPEQQRQRLQKTVGDSDRLRNAVADVDALLEAQIAETNGDYKEAAKHWFKAMNIAPASFGRRAFSGWVKALAKSFDQKPDLDVFVRLVLAESQNGKRSVYMRKNDIDDINVVTDHVLDLAADLLKLPEKSEVLDPALAPPEPGQMPPNDPVLAETAKRFCDAKGQYQTGWDNWQSSLSPAKSAYFAGLSARCKGEAERAMDQLAKALEQFDPNVDAAMITQALRNKVVLERRSGRRTAAADTYIELVKAWEQPSVQPQTMGLKSEEYFYEFTNDTLFAARYRALIGDYEQGKIYAQQGLQIISKAFAVLPAMTVSMRREFATLKAEAYHIMAYRIAVELKQYESARSLMLLGLQTRDLSAEWRDRMEWFGGLYSYLDGRFDEAKRQWEQLLANTSNESIKPRLYFWLARCHHQMKQSTESRFYLNMLAEDFPLSYYSVVAPLQANMTTPRDWREVFGEPTDLVNRLKGETNYDLGLIRRRPDSAKLLLRAEILAAAEIGEWSRLAVGDLERHMVDEARLAYETHLGPYRYLARLNYSVGRYLQTISLTTRINKKVDRYWRKHPEQLLLYFPRPYLDAYERAAMEQDLDLELMLAISRQESGFTPKIRSFANAIGLMQLIPPTGRRFAKELGLPTDDIQNLLQQPEANIQIGSSFLKFLTLRYKGFKPAIYGGYNAGEYAMDAWLERRAHPDPLVFNELIPFGETKGYIMNVWRNFIVYRYLHRGSQAWSRIGRRNNIELYQDVIQERGDLN